MYKKKKLHAQLTAYLLSFTLAFSAAGGAITALASDADERASIDATQTQEATDPNSRGEVSAQDDAVSVIPAPAQDQNRPASEQAQPAQMPAPGGTDERGTEQAAGPEAAAQTQDASDITWPDTPAPAQVLPQSEETVSDDYEINVDGSVLITIPPSGSLAKTAAALGGDSVTLTDAATGLRTKLTSSDNVSSVLSTLKTGTYLTVSAGDDDKARYLVSASGKTLSLTSVSSQLLPVRFDANGGSVEGGSLCSIFKGDAFSRFAPAARSGYQFAGWFYGPEETAARAYETDVITQGTTLYAHWTKGNVNTITYRFGYTRSGTAEDLSYTEPYAAVGGLYSVGRFPSLNVYGYVISAWTDEKGQAISGTQMSGDATVTASWEYNAAPAAPVELPAPASDPGTVLKKTRSAGLLRAGTFTVTVEIGENAQPASEASVAVSSEEEYYTLANVREALAAQYGSDWPADDKPTRDGYSFTSWKYESGSQSGEVAGLTDTMIQFTEALTLTAQWEEDTPLEASPVKIVCGETENSLYVNDEPRGTSGTGLSETLSAASACFSETATDFSSAKADYITIRTIDDEDGAEYDEAVRIPLSSGASASSALESASQEGILILYDDSEEIMRLSVTKTASSTYTMEMIPAGEYNLYRISYDANYDGAEEIRAVGHRTSSEALSYFDAEDPAREEYAFSGWYYDTSGEYKAQVSDIICEDTVLYAAWTSNDAHDVVYNMNDAAYAPGGTDTVRTFKSSVYGRNAMNDEDIDATLYAYTDDTSIFAGWYTTPSGGDPVSGQECTDDITTVYAHWAQALALYFYDDDGSEVYYIDPVTGADGYTLHQKNGDDYTLPSPNDKAGYQFVGWFTAPAGGSQVTEDTVLRSSMAEDSIISVYAHWYRGVYTITYDPAGGTFSDGTTAPKTVSVQSGDSLGSVPGATRDGYVFKGWKDAGGEEALSSTKPAADTAYTAQWKQRPIVVSSITLPKHSVTISTAAELDTLYKNFTYAPADATNATFKWTSGSPAVIRITDTSAKDKSTWASGSSPFATGTDGSAVITISSADGAISDSCTVTLKKKITVTSIDIYRNSTQRVTGTTIEVKYGENLNLSKVFHPGNAEEGITGTWTSSNPDVLTIPTADNAFIYKGIGTTVLTFTNSEGVSASVTVVVREDDKINEEHSVRTLAFVVPGTETVHIGDPVNLNIRYTPMIDVHNANFVWASDNPDVLGVSYDGRNVDHSYGGATGTAHITVATEDGTIHAVKTIVVVEKDSVDWTPDKKTYYTVSFETFGGSEIPDETVEAFNSAVLPTPAKEGFLFDGWYLDNSFSGESVTSLVPTADTVLYAHWVKDPNLPTIYTITFEPQNGESATLVSYQEGSMLGSFPEEGREGYRLIGWFTADDGGEEVTASTLVTGDAAYYAHWIDMAREGRYILTLDPNGGILDDSARAAAMQPDLVAGQGYWNNVSSEIPSMPGHRFIGYFDAKEGGTMVFGETGISIKGSPYFDADGNFTGRADLNVYAHWEETAEIFVLDFDSRGGSAVEPAVYDYNATAADFPTPAREGWTFLGWFEHATAGAPITSIQMDKNKTIYAQWEKDPTAPVLKDSYTVTFDTCGGNAIAPSTVSRGESVELPEPERDGYTFLGWYDAPTTGNHVKTLTPQDDVTLYAHWAKDRTVTKTFTITFDFQDGNTETFSGSAYDDGTSDTLTNFPAAEREGAVFNGWFTSPSGGVRVRSYSGDNDITLYAHFSESDPGSETPAVLEDFTITFDSQGGTEVASITEEAGTSVKDFEAPTRDGYSFLGWYTAPDGGNLVYSVILKKDVTLYAHWAVEPAMTYTVILDKQDGTSGTTYTMNAGETFTFPNATRAGYSFEGWFTSPTGGTPTTTYSGPAGSSATFYAQWSETTQENILVNKITLNRHELTITKGQALGLSYTYTPKNASNASFTWTSSNPDVIAVIPKAGDDGSTTQSLKVKSAGETALTVSTTDGTVSDSCKITVKEAAGKSTKTEPETPGNPQGSTNETGTSSGGSASTPAGSGTAANEAAEKYVLTIVSTTGSARKVTVKNSVTLDALATKLGYSVSTYKLKTAANTNETALDKNTTMSALASTGSTGDMLIIAYDASGTAMGSAKVSKTADDAFTVTLSKGTTAELKTYTSGRSDSGDSTTSLSGKSTSGTTAGTASGTAAATATADGKSGTTVVANPSKTGDPMRFAVALMILLGGICLALSASRRKKAR